MGELWTIGVFLLIPVWLYVVRYRYRKEKEKYATRRPLRSYETENILVSVLISVGVGGVVVFAWPIALLIGAVGVVLWKLYTLIDPTLSKIDERVDKVVKKVEDEWNEKKYSKRF